MEVGFDVEVAEVEFPYVGVAGAEVRKVPVGVGEGEAELDEIEGIDVGLHDSVVVVRREV